MRHLSDAGVAPRSPEIDQQQLSPIVPGVDRPPIETLTSEVFEFFSDTVQRPDVFPPGPLSGTPGDAHDDLRG